MSDDAESPRERARRSTSLPPHAPRARDGEPEGREGPRGLYPKFRIQRADGTPIPAGARHFVLRIDDDPHARAALRAYAASCAAENPALAADLTAALAEIEGDRAAGGRASARR